MTAGRYPVEALAEAFDIELSVNGGQLSDGRVTGLAGLVLLLEELRGFSPSTIKRRRAVGGFDAYEADRIALHLGLHPVDVWGDAWWRDGLAEVEPAGPSGLRPVVAGDRVVFELAAAA